MSMAGASESGKVSVLGELTEELGRFVHHAAAEGRSLREVERSVFDRLLQVGRAAINQFLVLQGDGDLGDTVTADNGQTLFRSAEPVARPLRTIFGEHHFSAFVYRKRRHPHTPIVLRPVDARLSLPSGRWSPLLEEFTQLFCLEGAYASAADAFARIFRQQLSVDTLEEVNQRMGAAAAEFLDGLAPPPAQEEGDLLVVTADGKGVPLVQDDAARLRCFEERPQRPGNRRMATLASVYSVHRHVRTPEEIVAALFRDVREQPELRHPRPQPCHKRVIARFPKLFEELDETKPISGSIIALSWAAVEVEQRRRTGQPLVRLMDGQTSLWDAADACLADSLAAGPVFDILDIVHVASYVWRAAKVFHTHREHQEAFVRDRLLRILQGGVHGVIQGLRHRATRCRLAGAAREEVDTVCGYFTTHARRMNYDEYLAAGCPIATGVIEGACRHLVKDRMERSGMRWTQTHAQAMLDLRAVHQSSYWDDFHQQRIANQQASSQPFRNLLPPLNTLTG
jgi:hypothetical protein